jgi:hypothetical protein
VISVLDWQSDDHGIHASLKFVPKRIDERGSLACILWELDGNREVLNRPVRRFVDPSVLTSPPASWIAVVFPHAIALDFPLNTAIAREISTTHYRPQINGE